MIGRVFPEFMFNPEFIKHIQKVPRTCEMIKLWFLLTFYSIWWMKYNMLGCHVRYFGLCTQNSSFVGLLYHYYLANIKLHVSFLVHVKMLKFCAFRMDKTIIDAILSLSLDDSTSNLAAAALFYILTSDVSYFMFSTFFPRSCDVRTLLKPQKGASEIYTKATGNVAFPPFELLDEVLLFLGVWTWMECNGWH